MDDLLDLLTYDCPITGKKRCAVDVNSSFSEFPNCTSLLLHTRELYYKSSYYNVCKRGPGVLGNLPRNSPGLVKIIVLQVWHKDPKKEYLPQKRLPATRYKGLLSCRLIPNNFGFIRTELQLS